MLQLAEYMHPECIRKSTKAVVSSRCTKCGIDKKPLTPSTVYKKYFRWIFTSLCELSERWRWKKGKRRVSRTSESESVLHHATRQLSVSPLRTVLNVFVCTGTFFLQFPLLLWTWAREYLENESDSRPTSHLIAMCIFSVGLFSSFFLVLSHSFYLSTPHFRTRRKCCSFSPI